MTGRLLTIRALSAIHSGSGQGSGVVDQPVVRERITNWPCLNGESIKGVLRDTCDNDGTNTPYSFEAPGSGAFFQAFGPPTDRASEFAGSLMFSTGTLLCFPLRSYFGVFAWVTCPMAIQRWADDHRTLGFDSSNLELDTPPTSKQILIPKSGTSLLVPEASAKVHLETYAFDPITSEQVGALATYIAERVFDSEARATRFSSQFAVLSDDVFTFLVDRCTTRTAHIRLDERSKTVAEGALWYEEDVPMESIFSAPVWLSGRATLGDDIWTMVNQVSEQPIQIGGNKSVGRGVARFSFTNGATA